MAAGRRRVAMAVVGDAEAGLPGLVLKVQPGLRGAGVADHIPQAFLGDLEQRMLYFGRELALRAADAHRYAQRAGGAEITGQISQRLPQALARALQLGQLGDRRANPAQARTSQFLTGHQPLIRSRGGIKVPVTPLQVHPDPDQALRDAVVQLARDPVTFGTH